MREIIITALTETLWMFPLLFAIYVIIEFIELKYGNDINNRIGKTVYSGPFLGSFFGSLPQCGFSVLSSALYSKRLITVGTLLAVYLSTSDEAIPVILAQPDKIPILIPILITKVAIAIVAGYSIDISRKVLNKPGKKIISGGDIRSDDIRICADHGCSIDEKGCCGHSFSAGKIKLNHLLIHPFFHTVKISVFIFVVSMAIGYAVFKIGDENLYGILLGESVFQPVITAAVGLIPNCAASVVITEMYLKGGLSFGSVISGLCTSAGLGLLVLFRENSSRKDSIKIVLLLFAISVAAGIIIQQCCAF